MFVVAISVVVLVMEDVVVVEIEDVLMNYELYEWWEDGMGSLPFHS